MHLLKPNLRCIARDIGLYVSSDKIRVFNQDDANTKLLKFIV